MAAAAAVACSPSSSRLALLVLLLPLLVCPCSCQTCSKSYTFNGESKLFANCDDLSAQKASIAWSLQPQNNTLEVLFSGTAPSSGGWVGWGINPDASGPPAMVGTQAFIAFQASNGSTILTYNVTADTKAGSPLKCTPIALDVLDMGVHISGGGTSIAMLVSLRLVKNPRLLNIVWSRGGSVTDFQPGVHGFSAADLSGLKTINISSGAVTSSTPHYLLKNRHAVLNTVGWGVLLPLGVIAARYLRPFTDPTWLYTHVLIQMAGYSLGVAGWATGLRLGGYSVGVVYTKHRSIGIALFAIATSQVTAILLRPKKELKIRKGWNFYHYTLGVTILVLGILNIFYGFDILSPPSKWRHAYIGVLGALASLVVVFEICSWVHFASKKHPSHKKLQGVTIGGAHVQVL